MTDPITQSMMQGAAGAAGGDDIPIRENMWALNSYLGDSNASTSIVNGLNMAKGGMIMTKRLDGSAGWDVRDTVSGGGFRCRANEDLAQEANDPGYTFNSDGYNPGDGVTTSWTNTSGSSYQSACFRKHKGFFDVVKYTGTGSARTVAHELETQPGMMWVKNLTDGGRDWCVWHESLGHGSGYNSANYNVQLNSTDAQNASSGYWNNTLPTSTHFTVGDHNETNENGKEYIAYIWADGHTDAGSAIFGPNEDQTLCKTGFYTGNGSTQDIVIGFEPEFMIIKAMDSDSHGANWGFLNTQLGWGFPDGGSAWIVDGKGLKINTTDQAANFFRIYPYPQQTNGGLSFYQESWWNTNGVKYLYIAFKGPSVNVSGTANFGEFTGEDYLQIDAAGDSNANCPPGCFVSSNTKRSFPPDFTIRKEKGGSSSYKMSSRLTRTWEWTSDDYSAPSKNGTNVDFLSSTGYSKSLGSSWQSWMLKGGPGLYHRFYKGTNSNHSVYHELGTAPEMVWLKRLGAGNKIAVGHKGYNNGTTPWNYYLDMNDVGSTTFDQSVFAGTTNGAYVRIGNASATNNSSDYFSMVCFASVAGISKVDSYQGDGTTSKFVSTGFQPRFLIIKCYSDGGTNWTLWDSVRGWDKKLELNSGAAEVTAAWVSVSATGFTLIDPHPEVNANAYRYIYYAHA